MLLAATVFCGLATTAQAATYTLVNQVYNQFTQSIGASLNFSFTVDNAAVTRGTFNLSGFSDRDPLTGRAFPVYTGDVADFVSFTANETATRNQIPGTLSIQASFAADGSLAASTFVYEGASERSNLSGNAAAFGGTFGSTVTNFRCGRDSCAVSGQVIATGLPAQPVRSLLPLPS